MADNDKLLVVPLGRESKSLTQIMSNDTAMQIIGLIADGPMSTSAIAEKLNIPLTTAQYNIEKLMEAGLVKVEKTKYSEKGREVKLYKASNRYIVLVPDKTGGQAVIEALKKYLLLIPAAIIMSAAVEYLVPLSPYSNSPATQAGAVAGKEASNPLVYSANNPVACPIPAPGVSDAYRSFGDNISQGLVPVFHHAGLLFFAGCMLVLVLLAGMEYARQKKALWPKK